MIVSSMLLACDISGCMFKCLLCACQAWTLKGQTHAGVHKDLSVHTFPDVTMACPRGTCMLKSLLPVLNIPAGS